MLNSPARRHSNQLQTDIGKEFFDATFVAVMKRHNIQHFANESDQKAAVVERFNRTIKTCIWTYLSAAQPFAGLTSSKSSWTRTIIRTINQLGWRRRVWTNVMRTQSGHYSMETLTRT